MKRLLLVVSVLSMLFVGSVSSLTVRAADGVRFDPSSTNVNNIGGCDGTAANSPICQDIQNTENPLFGPDGVLTRVAGIFGIVTGVIAVFMMLIGGLRYITSSGDPQKAATARKTIIYASVGVVIAAVAGILVRYVLSRINNG
jgi:hypothetical protein